MRKRAKFVLILVFSLLFAGILYIIFYSLTGFGIPCVFHLLTGLECPGCGATRMIISVFHLDFKAAFKYNAALLVLSPVILFLLIQILIKYIKTGNQTLNKGQSVTLYVLIVLLILFTIVRNVPYILSVFNMWF